jgi:hypothetical protein
MRYTIARLHKELGNLIDAGHGRKIVHINKDSFQHNLESNGCVIMEVVGLGIQNVPVIDDDGGTKWNRDGGEASMTVLVLAGGQGANSKGQLVPVKF